MFIVQINDSEGILKELVHVGADRGVAEGKFIGACEIAISNWGEFPMDDIDDIVNEGYAQFGGGVVMLIDTSNCVTDEELVAELGNFPPKNVQKITRWVQTGEIGELATIDEVLEQAGRCLDAACSWDICGPILFQAEDGKWYTMTTEAVIAVAHPQYVKDTLDAEGTD